METQIVEPYPSPGTRQPFVGESVVYVDPVGVAHAALITAPWGPTCVNLLYVSSDAAKSDVYGRQIERQSSCSHASVVPVHGNLLAARGRTREAHRNTRVVRPCGLGTDEEPHGPHGSDARPTDAIQQQTLDRPGTRGVICRWAGKA